MTQPVHVEEVLPLCLVCTCLWCFNHSRTAQLHVGSALWDEGTTVWCGSDVCVCVCVFYVVFCPSVPTNEQRVVHLVLQLGWFVVS